MCESDVYLRTENNDELVMKDAVWVKNLDGKIRVTDALGEEKEFDGSLAEVTFLDHRVVIKS